MLRQNREKMTALLMDKVRLICEQQFRREENECGTKNNSKIDRTGRAAYVVTAEFGK